MSVPDKKTSAREILASIALAAAGFLVAAGAIHATMRDPVHLHADVRSEKLAMLKQWHGTVFSAAFGSSHVHNGFDPRAFDRSLAGTPLATRSANLAVEGGSQSEQRVMALQFVQQLESPAHAHAPGQPCLVMLELEAGANFTTDHLVHPRSINIYDWPTARLITHFVSPEMSPMQRVGRVGFALAAMGLHYSNVGMLSNTVFAPPLNSGLLADQTADDRRGELVEPPDARNLLFDRDLIAKLPEKPETRIGVLSPGNSELISQLASASPVRDLSFVYLVMPRLGDLGSEVTYPDHISVDGKEIPIINLARPDRFPQLYSVVLWHDGAHLTGEGAELASTLLGKELTKWYAAHGTPPRCGG